MNRFNQHSIILKISPPPSFPLVMPSKKDTAVAGGPGQLGLSDWCCWWGWAAARLSEPTEEELDLNGIFRSNEPYFTAHSKA